MPIAINELPQDVDACHSLIQQMHVALEQAQTAVQDMHSDLQQTHAAFKQMHTQLQQSHQDIELLKQQVQYLVRARFGKKSERVNHTPDQLRLFYLPALAPDINSHEEQTITTDQHPRKGLGSQTRD